MTSAPPAAGRRTRRLGGGLAVATLAVGLAMHVATLRRLDGYVDADEAVVALMAVHIGEGLARPVFYYGQPYLGALEAYGAAAAFFCAGVEPMAARGFLVLVWVALALTCWRLPRLAGLGGASGLSALGLAAVVPPSVLAWHLKLRGGFLLGALLVALTIAAAAGALRWPRAAGRAFLFGVVAGVALWTNQLTAPIVAVFAAAVAVDGRRGWLAAGLASGAAPLVVYNVVAPLATVRYLVAHWLHGVTTSSAGLTELVARSLPALTGGPELAIWLGSPPVHFLGLVLTLVAVVAVAVARWRPLVAAIVERRPPALIDLTLVALLLSLPLRRNAELNQLLHWTPLLVLLVASAAAVSGRRLLAAIPGALIGLALVETALWLPRLRATDAGERALVSALEARGVRAVHAEHRPAYLIAFHSRERIAATPSLSADYFVDRYPPYGERVAADPSPAYVLDRGSPNEERVRERFGFAGPAEDIAGYRVFFRDAKASTR